jgi:uncharacterized repeat protein (TIGR03803 family)
MYRLSRFAVLFCIATAFALSAQVPTSAPTSPTFTSLFSFNDTDGNGPAYGALVQGANGNLYGTTPGGGAHFLGTVFEITPTGSLTTLYSFCSKSSCADGMSPYGGLVLATNGNFYGTTTNGGANFDGTVFEITPNGALTTLYSFCAETNCTDGSIPYNSLVQGSNGNLYGTTYEGGAYNYGTVFEITTAGKLRTLHSFDDSDGAYPYDALIQATNGDLYGTTHEGGSRNGGTFFQITTAGAFSVLYNFCSETNCTDGGYPYAGVVQGGNGDFYGTTPGGGTNNTGTVYRVTSAGAFTAISDIPIDSGGAVGGLVLGTDGNFYGTTDDTIYDVTPAGKLTTLYTGVDLPEAALLQATNGTFYGTTESGGAELYGTVFSLSNGLGAFVTTNPTSGVVGKSVTILGSDLTGATSVTFDGVSASFKVVSGTEITTTVPTGATTGTVEVVTPSKTLKSNVKFTVKG